MPHRNLHAKLRKLRGIEEDEHHHAHHKDPKNGLRWGRVERKPTEKTVHPPGAMSVLERDQWEQAMRGNQNWPKKASGKPVAPRPIGPRTFTKIGRAPVKSKR